MVILRFEDAMKHKYLQQELYFKNSTSRKRITHVLQLKVSQYIVNLWILSFLKVRTVVITRNVWFLWFSLSVEDRVGNKRDKRTRKRMKTTSL